jgi:integrase
VREARQLERQRVAELEKRSPDPFKRAQKLASLSVASAIDQYAEERRSQVSVRMISWWKEMGRAPKTINSELSVLRQVMKHAKLWYRLSDEYRPLKNTKPPVGQALTDEEQTRLFKVAKSNPAWLLAYVAATLDIFCGLRACEICSLQWKHVSWDHRRLSVRRSKHLRDGGIHR